MSVCGSGIPASNRLSNEAAATYIGIRPQTLSKWRCTSRFRIPYLRVGSRVFYRVVDLDAWLAQQVVTGGATQEASQ